MLTKDATNIVVQKTDLLCYVSSVKYKWLPNDEYLIDFCKQSSFDFFNFFDQLSLNNLDMTVNIVKMSPNNWSILWLNILACCSKPSCADEIVVLTG